MSKVISVSIPDDLYRGYLVFKSEIGLSALFQNALREAVDRKERFSKKIMEDLNMEKLAEGFIEDEEKDAAEWEEQGAADALFWIRNAERKEIKRALTAWERYGAGYNDPTKDPILGDYFEDAIRDCEFDDYEEEFPHWLRGWTKGVEKAWREIEKIIQAKKAQK